MERNNARSASIIKLVIWAVVLLILIAVFASLMVGYAFGRNKTFGMSTIYPDGDSYNIGSTEYTVPVSDIEIDWLSGSLQILVWDEDNIKVEEAGEITDDDEKLRSRIDEGKLQIKYVKSGFGFFRGMPEKALTVYVPSSFAENLGEVDISAVGNVEIKGLGMRSVDVENASGIITLDGVRASQAEIGTASGEISVKGDFVELDIDSASGNTSFDGVCEKIDVDVASGDVMLKGEFNTVDISSASGRVEINALNPTIKRIDADTASGNIYLTVSGEMPGFSAELDSASGRTVIKNGENTAAARHYEYGDKNAAKFNLDTASGNIEIIIQ